MADRDCIIEADGQAATVKIAVDNLFAQRAAAPEKSHLLICKSNATRRTRPRKYAGGCGPKDFDR
jgi:hypothetical protein